MDTGENKLNAEMMKKLYEAYKLNTKKKIDEFNEAARKIISDKEYPEAEDILKLVEGSQITDNHERRIHDPSIYKLHGRQVLNVFFDEQYPVMMPEDVKTMRGMSDEIRKKFQDYVESETGIPRETLVIDSIPENVREKAEHDAILYGDSFVSVYRAPRWVERYLETQRWIDGIKDPEIDILTGATQNFKQQQNYDQLEALCDILGTEAPDRNGRVWKREALKGFMNNKIYLTPPRGHKSWMWLKLLEMELQKSYEINVAQTLNAPPSTKVDLKSVIYMKWPKQDLSNLKAKDCRMRHALEELVGYNDLCPISQMIVDSFEVCSPEMLKQDKLVGPNFNEDKKRLERVIKKRRKKK